jgi:hypothetical protein
MSIEYNQKREKLVVFEAYAMVAIGIANSSQLASKQLDLPQRKHAVFVLCILLTIIDFSLTRLIDFCHV